MKKLCRILMITVALACLLVIHVFASNYDSAAQELKTLGLFQGTNAGFDLDRAPTRAEASVMLVRLLGAENEAKTQYAAGTVSHPFTDVPDWASPYIAWLYSNNLAKGVSDTAFGATGQCTSKMYCTFILRALGYNDAEGDFSFDESEDLAEYLGVFDSDMGQNTFLRDQAVAISYRALAVSLNGTDTLLLEKLISDGAVSQTAASSLLTKAKNYAAYVNAYEKSNSVAAISTTTNESLTVKNTKASGSYTDNVRSTYKGISGVNDLQMEYTRNENDGTDNVTYYEWIKDGYYYYKDDTMKTKTELDDSLMESLFSSGPSPLMPALYDLKSVTVSQGYPGTQFVLTYADDYDYFGYLNSTRRMGFDASEIMNYSVGKCSLTVTEGSDGLISSYKNEYKSSFLYDYGDTIAPLNLSYTMENVVNATGSSVSIQFPDFSDYTLNE